MFDLTTGIKAAFNLGQDPTGLESANVTFIQK